MELVLICSVVFLAALTQGFLGFGFGIMAMGLLCVSLDVVQVAGLVNLTGVFLNGLRTWRLREHLAWPITLRLFAGVVVGLPVGLWLLGSLDTTLLERLLGGTIVVVSLWNLSPWRPEGHTRRRWDAPVGIASGVLTGMFNSGGPPLVAHVYRRPDPPDTQRAIVQTIFFAAGLLRMGGAIATDTLGPTSVWIESAVALVFVLAGVQLGVALGRRVSPARFRSSTWLALCAMGVWILLRASAGADPGS